MIKTQIKSILRSKFNRLYILVFFILFTILNFSVNIVNIIDRYYDKKVENFLQENAEMAETYEYVRTYEESEEWIRTVQITSNNREQEQLTEDEMKKIKGIKNVKDFKIKINEYPQYDITFYTKCVIVDDWKNCTYVETQLDKMGYTVYTDNQFIEEYTTVRIYANLVSGLILIIAITMFIICYKNILHNEKENMKLLSIMGYNKNRIGIIKVTVLTVLTLIGYIASATIYGIGLIILK